MKSIVAIARTTITDLRRQKLLIIPIVGVVLSLIALAGAILTDGGSPELAADEAELIAFGVGLATGLGGALYALVVGASLIAREISDGTMLMLAARPIGRWQVILGRLLGAGTFIVLALLGTCVVYGITASLLAVDLAPFEDPLQALWLTIPGVLLALCVGTTFSVQGRATAAMGSAVLFGMFALMLSAYVDAWRTENHVRSYLEDSDRALLEANDPFVGRVSAAMVQLMPYGIFAGHAISSYDDREEDGTSYPDGYRPDTITPGSSSFSYSYAPTVNGVSSEPTRPSEDDRRRDSERCASTGGDASCFLQTEDAWTAKSFPARPELYDGLHLLFAWLAIPLWIGMAVLLLTRRRDLA